MVIQRCTKFSLRNCCHLRNIHINPNAKKINISSNNDASNNSNKASGKRNEEEDGGTAVVREQDIQLYIPKSIEHEGKFQLREPERAPPEWMLKYFPDFFKKDAPEEVGPEEHDQPLGESGVYGYIATLIVVGIYLSLYLFRLL